MKIVHYLTIFFWMTVLPASEPDIYAESDLRAELLKQFTEAKKAIVINQTVRDLTKTSCTLNDWNQVEQYVCRCCIVHAVDTVLGTEFDGKTILENCKKQGVCTEALITALKKEEDLEKASNTEFVKIIYDRSLIIKQVSIDPTSALYQTGIFTEESLKNFLASAYKSGRLLEKGLAHASDLEVSNIKSKGGGLTEQLFVVKNKITKQEFIVKEMIKSKEEIFNLTLAAHYKPLKPYIAPNSVANFPILSFPISYLSYTANNKTHYLSIMLKAQGTEFYQLRLDLTKNPSPANTAKLKKAYAALGTTLGNFHKTFMKNNQGAFDASSLLGKTIVHGDLHARNLFYDANDDSVYWIDNEKMGKSIIDPRNAAIDLQFLLEPYHFWDDLFKPGQEKNWFATYYPSFFNAYLAAFGGDIVKHAQELKELCSERGTWGMHIDYTFTWLYIDPILDDIIAKNSARPPVAKTARRMPQRMKGK